MKLRYSIKSIFAAFLLIVLIISAQKIKTSCFDALILCGRLIIPSLFPFLVMSAFISKLGLPGIIGRIIAPFACKVYGISPAGASALIMGFIGGYPSGAAYIAAMEKDGIISPDEGERLIAFCNNSGPAFIVGVIGTGIFHSVKTGLVLYGVHIVSALISGLIFRAKEYSKAVPPHRLDETNTAEALVASVKQATQTIINICGFVIFFSILIALSNISALKSSFAKALISGILELGNGAAAISTLDAGPLSLSLAAGMLGWGGLSVHFQTLAVLSESKIKGSLHLAGRLISAMISFILMYALSIF